MSTFSTSSRQKRLKTLSFLHFWLRNVLRATTACTFSTLFRHLSLQKWCPRPSVFNTFDLEMCFAPQRRALFRHRNFQKWSDHGVFCAFWLQNVLRATTACTFSTSQLPKVVRSSSVLSILTWKCASRHNGVHFSMSHLASWPRTRRFSEPTFRPSGATNHWKNTVNRDFPIFSRIYLFFLLILSLLTLLTSAFQLSILSEVSLLNFLRKYLVEIWIIILIPCYSFWTYLLMWGYPARIVGWVKYLCLHIFLYRIYKCLNIHVFHVIMGIFQVCFCLTIYIYIYVVYICICVCTCIYIYIHVYIYIHTYTHTYIHTYITLHTYIHTLHYITYIHTHIHTYIHTHIHTHTHTYIHTYIHTCTYIYIIHNLIYLVSLVICSKAQRLWLHHKDIGFHLGWRGRFSSRRASTNSTHMYIYI